MSLTLESLTVSQRRELARAQNEAAADTATLVFAAELRAAVEADDGMAVRMAWSSRTSEEQESVWSVLHSYTRRILKQLIDATEGW